MFRKGKRYNNSFIITDTIYSSFINCSLDRNPLHTNDDYAISKGFNERVMHGNILNAFLSYFVGECLEIKNVLIQSQNINFSRPFFLKDILRLEVIVENTYESINTVEFRYKFYNDATNEKVAFGKFFISII